MSAASPWSPELPPWSHTADGRLRRVGIELELIGPSVDAVAQVTARVLRGSMDPRSAYEVAVLGDPAGEWMVELDYGYLKELGRERAASHEPPSLSESLLSTGADVLVPVEVISPPLPIDRLEEVQQLFVELRRLGAMGTRAGLAYAFGVQLNPELPRLDAETILAYLRAYLCLQAWLLREEDMDVTRKLTGYAAPFGEDYARRLMAEAYRPDLATLIDDYLAANPTRNRALDCLPLFLELDAPRVRRIVDDERVKPRPTFHYRLPNSEIDDPRWGLHVCWEAWLQVERVAADGAGLADLCRRYAAYLDRTFHSFIGDWPAEVAQWLDRS